MITVAVCTYNPDLPRLERTLEAIAQQTIPSVELDVLIVDSRSDNPVAGLEVVRRSGARVVREERPGLTAARERASREARGEIIVFPDDDTVLARGYLAAAAELMCDPAIGMLSGHIEPEYEVSPPRWIRRFEPSLAVRRLAEEHLAFATGPTHTESFPVGAGCVIRAEVLCAYCKSLESGLRIEGRRGSELSAGEDLDIALFALHGGWRVGVSGRLRLHHLIPPNRLRPSYLGRLQVGALRSAVAVERKWRPVTGAPVFPFLHVPRWKTGLKALAYSLLAWLPVYRIRAAVQWELLRLAYRPDST